MLMYGSNTSARTPKRQVGTLTPTLSLEGLRDLLQALQPELEAAHGLIPLWSAELKRELNERLRQ